MPPLRLDITLIDDNIRYLELVEIEGAILVHVKNLKGFTDLSLLLLSQIQSSLPSSSCCHVGNSVGLTRDCGILSWIGVHGSVPAEASSLVVWREPP